MYLSNLIMYLRVQFGSSDIVFSIRCCLEAKRLIKKKKQQQKILARCLFIYSFIYLATHKITIYILYT